MIATNRQKIDASPCISKMEKKFNKAHLRELEKEREQKDQAHRIVANEVKQGRLIKQPCQVCGEKKVEAHHDDYAQPINIVWVCKKHHVELDRLKRNADLKEKTGIILD